MTKKPVQIGDLLREVDFALIEVREAIHVYETEGNRMRGKSLALVQQRIISGIRKVKAGAERLERFYNQVYRLRAQLDRAELEAETEERPKHAN